MPAIFNVLKSSLVLMLDIKTSSFILSIETYCNIGSIFKPEGKSTVLAKKELQAEILIFMKQSVSSENWL